MPGSSRFAATSWAWPPIRSRSRRPWRCWAAATARCGCPCAPSTSAGLGSRPAQPRPLWALDRVSIIAYMSHTVDTLFQDICNTAFAPWCRITTFSTRGSEWVTPRRTTMARPRAGRPAAGYSHDDRDGSPAGLRRRDARAPRERGRRVLSDQIARLTRLNRDAGGPPPRSPVPAGRRPGRTGTASSLLAVRRGRRDSGGPVRRVEFHFSRKG